MPKIYDSVKGGKRDFFFLYIDVTVVYDMNYKM